jgi:phosphoribosylformylglycinamidine cyclo-ligase
MLEHHQHQIHGIIHCSGGAQTKVLKFVKDVKIVKDQLFTPPPLFQLIREATGTSYQEMYKVFNMGHRMELYIDPEAADSLIQIASEFGVEAQIIGRVEKGEGAKLELLAADGENLHYIDS